jgi:hemoglobin/transferrin/lactoferrin receptor protein
MNPIFPLLFVFAVCLQAQTVTDLPTVEVTGTRLSDPPFEQPYALYRSTRAELEPRVGRTALDRFNYAPGVFIQNTAPNQASPFIRGLTGEQSLLLLDGVRLSHAMMRPGPNQYAALVPDVSIRAIDAILGSSSVVNGSDGLTGALDFRLAPAGRGITEGSSLWITSRIDTGNGGKVQGGVDGAQGNWLYSFELSATQFHDRVGGEDVEGRVFGLGAGAYEEIPNTAYDEYAAGLRLAYVGLEDRVLEIKAGHNRQEDAPRPDGYFENTGDDSRISRFFDPMTFSYLHLRDTWDVNSGTVDTLQTTLWWHQFGEDQFREELRDGGTRYRRREYKDTLDAFGADLQATTPWGDAHELTWGGTFLFETTSNEYREFRTPTGVTDPTAAVIHNPGDWSNNTTISDGSEYTTLGLFAQDNWQMTDAVSLLTGVRYSRMEWSFGDVEGDADDVTGSVRGLLDLTPSQRVFVGVSKAFRAPNLQNLDGAVDRGSSGQAAQGNPDLEPEISWTTEGGWRWQEDRNSLGVSLFHTEIDDLIQRDFRDGAGAFTNVEGATLYGAETAWELGLLEQGDARLSLVGSASLVDAVKDVPQPDGSVREDNISRANRLYGRVGLRVDQGRNWWGLVQVRWHDDYDDVATDPGDSDASDIRLTVAGNPDGSMPGYEIVDLLCGWERDDGNVHLTFFIENLADETYREPGSGTDGTGRSFGISGGVRF